MADVLNSEALQEVVALGQKIGQPITTEKIHYAIIPEESQIVSLRDYQYPFGITPERIAAKVNLRDSLSFERYFQLFSDDRSRVFAEPSSATFVAILDYHGVGERKPEHLTHRAVFQMEKSDEWKTWFGSNQKNFTQADFAEFIEDNMLDVVTPDPATMLEVARDLHAHTEVNFASSTRLQSGQVQLKYTEEIKAGVGSGNLQVPETFTIKIPVFYGEDAVAIQIRLRFRITNGKLTFHYKMNRPTEVLNDAFNEAVKSVGEALKVDVWIGGLQSA